MAKKDRSVRNHCVSAFFNRGFQRPLTLVLLQRYRDADGSRIVIQIGGVYTTFSHKGVHFFCKSIAVEMGGVARYLSKASGQGSIWLSWLKSLRFKMPTSSSRPLVLWPFFTQISGRNFLPQICGEVHPETASSLLCPLLYRTEQHFARGGTGQKDAQKRIGRGVASKGGKKEKRTSSSRPLVIFWDHGSRLGWPATEWDTGPEPKMAETWPAGSERGGAQFLMKELESFPGRLLDLNFSSKSRSDAAFNIPSSRRFMRPPVNYSEIFKGYALDFWGLGTIFSLSWEILILCSCKTGVFQIGERGISHKRVFTLLNPEELPLEMAKILPKLAVLSSKLRMKSRCGCVS